MSPRTLARIEWLAVVLAIAGGLAHRLLFGWYAPLWLDETYTGVIAAQPGLAGLFEWCRQELSGPIYYAGMWAWEKLAGDGNTALRLPSLIASLGAVVLIAAWGPEDRRERWLWAALTAIWLPGLLFVAQARPQALLLLLATGQAIAFLRCADLRSRRWLTVWAALGALLVLTHIHAAVITGLQFICLLSTIRPKLRDIAPALAIFAVAAAWLPLQWSFMTGILKPGAAWYPLLGPADLWKLPGHLFAENVAAIAVAAIVAIILGLQWKQRRSTGTPMPYARGEAMLALTALASVVLVYVAGYVRPSFAARYFFPYMPALLFGLTIVLARTRLLLGLLPAIVLATWTGTAALNATAYAGAEAQQTLNPLEFERGSNWLMANNARRVLFVWDNPSSALSGDTRQAEVANFFFRRAGYSVRIRAAFIEHARQTPEHLARLADAEGAAILWVGGADYPAGLHGIAGLECRDFGGGKSRSIACVRRLPAGSEQEWRSTAPLREP